MPFWIWVIVTAGPAIAGTAIGALVAHALETRARRRGNAILVVRRGFDRLKGEFDPSAMPGLKMPTDGPTGIYYHLTVVNEGTEQEAENCIPYVYYVFGETKLRTPGLWLPSPIRQRDEDDEFRESIPARGALPFCCFAVSEHGLHAFDMDLLQWRRVAGEGTDQSQFTMIVAVSSTNAMCKSGQEYDIEFDAETNGVRVVNCREVFFQDTNPDLYVGAK